MKYSLHGGKIAALVLLNQWKKGKTTPRRHPIVHERKSINISQNPRSQRIPGKCNFTMKRNMSFNVTIYANHVVKKNTPVSYTSIMWVIICVRTWCFNVNLLPHTSQEYGFSPVWMRKWRVMSVLVLHNRPQWSQVYPPVVGSAMTKQYISDFNLSV